MRAPIAILATVFLASSILNASGTEVTTNCPRGAEVQLSVPTNAAGVPDAYSGDLSVIGFVCLDRPDTYYTVKGLEDAAFGSPDRARRFAQRAQDMFGYNKAFDPNEIPN
jgi:hypothetical protein